MASTQGLATLLWIILVVFIFVVYYLLFRNVKAAQANASKPPLAGDASASTDGPIVVNPMEVNPMVAPVAVKEVERVLPSRTSFGLKMIEEWVYNNVLGNTYYAVGVDQEMIKVTRIWSRYKKQVDLAYGPNPHELFRKTLASADFEGSMRSAPLAMFTHIESVAVGSPPSFHLWKLICGWFHFFVRNSIFFLMLLMTLAVILTFYVPGTMDNATSGSDRARQSKGLTVAIFLLTVVSLVFHALYIYGCRTAAFPSLYNASKSILPWGSLLFLLISFCIAATLVGIVYGSQDANADNSNANSFVNAAHGFTCYCPGLSPSGIPTAAPTHSPTVSVSYSNDYTFLCTSDELSAADYNTCDMNCGVCGDTYYQPFVSYTVFAACYLFLILYLAFDAWFAGHVFLAPYPDPEYDAHTHMFITIHGSGSFGYPLYCRLALNEALQLEEYLSNYSHREQARRNGDFLNHMKSVGSSMTQQSITTKASKSVDYVVKFFVYVVRFALRLLGIPI